MNILLKLFIGVVAQYKEDQRDKPRAEQYIQAVKSELSEDGKGDVEVVVTMHPKMDELIHNARYSVHDTPINVSVESIRNGR